MRRLNFEVAASALAIVLAAACGDGTPQNATETASGSVQVTLTTEPDPPRMGENTFEAMVTTGGQPVTDADVSVELFMPAMPEMKMAEMRNTLALKHEGGGRYRGTGNVMMAGKWDATVSVKRGGQELGPTRVAITAR